MFLTRTGDCWNSLRVGLGHFGSPIHGVVATGLLAVGVWFLLSVYRAACSPLRSVPGPFLARFTNAWYLWRLRNGHFEVDNLKLHKQYGSVVRLGPNRYSFNDSSALNSIYGPGRAFPKAPSYRPAAPPQHDRWTLFADEDVQRHARNRRLYQSTYSMSSLVTYEAYVDTCTDLFAQQLTNLARAGTSMDMGYWFQCYAFDVIGLITYSRRLGFLDAGEDVGSIIRTIDNEMVYFVLTGVYHFLHQLLFPIRNWIAGKKGTGRTYLMNFTRERVAEYQSRPAANTEEAEIAASPMDFLTKFFVKHAADPATFTMYHVLAGCASNIVAGSDTTATSLSGILYFLLRNPETLERVRVEVDGLESRAEGSQHVTWTEGRSMPYLQAVIKEALRLHPAVALPMERVVPKGGVAICGHFFQEGTVVGINPWVHLRNSEVFGSDAHDFKPERWLTMDSETLGQMNRHWIAFGAGDRTCIGRHIAYLQMSKLVPRLVRDFDFELCDGLRDRDQGWVTRNFFFLKPVDFRVSVRLRRSS